MGSVYSYSVLLQKIFLLGYSVDVRTSQFGHYKMMKKQKKDKKLICYGHSIFVNFRPTVFSHEFSIIGCPFDNESDTIWYLKRVCPKNLLLENPIDVTF
jgi:hypothetical protein